jgi:hypothetical protein
VRIFFSLSAVAESFKKYFSTFPQLRNPLKSVFQSFRNCGIPQKEFSDLSAIAESFTKNFSTFPQLRNPLKRVFQSFRSCGIL